MHLPHYSTNRVLDPKPYYAAHPDELPFAAITTVLGSASAGARGSSPFDLARQGGLHFGLMLRRWRGFPGSEQWAR